MGYPITKPCKEFREEVFAQFPALKDWGYYNRRKIAGTDVWSQHAWGNAQDLAGPTQLLDLANAWIQVNRSRLRVRVLLWRVPAHFDHIHVDFYPKKQGTPPFPEEDDVEELVKAIQRSLNGAGFRDMNGAPLTVDGLIGPKTEFAMASRDTAAAEGNYPTNWTITGGNLEMEGGD